LDGAVVSWVLDGTGARLRVCVFDL
jgi:hypothetical protein